MFMKIMKIRNTKEEENQLWAPLKTIKNQLSEGLESLNGAAGASAGEEVEEL
jgi:hypothetical protein